MLAATPVMPRFLIPLLLALGGAMLAMKVGPAEQAAVARQLENFPDTLPAAHLARPTIAVALCFLPAIAGMLYMIGDTLSRYVARQFLTLFLICLCGLFVIWLIADLGDNLDDLKRTKDPARLGVELYTARLPEILVTLLPYSLLLSILYSLGRLSRSREIVAMIQTGRGIGRLTLPYFIAGIAAAILCAGLNYQWAPASLAAESALFRRARGLDSVAEPNIRYRNFEDRRLWMIGSFPPDYQKGAPLERISVTLENPDGTLQKKIFADSASWSPATRAWTFHKPMIAVLNAAPDGKSPDFISEKPSDPLVIEGWSEVPAELIRPGLPASQLGIPDLNDSLAANPLGTWARREGQLTQWHYRWAQPVACIIVVMLAVPLGVVFSRRGTSGGVAVAVFLSAGMLFFSNASISMGDSGHLRPALAAWLPNAVFGIIALWLCQRRLSGRPIYQVLRKLLPAET